MVILPRYFKGVIVDLDLVKYGYFVASKIDGYTLKLRNRDKLLDYSRMPEGSSKRFQRLRVSPSFLFWLNMVIKWPLKFTVTPLISKIPA